MAALVFRSFFFALNASARLEIEMSENSNGESGGEAKRSRGDEEEEEELPLRVRGKVVVTRKSTRSARKEQKELEPSSSSGEVATRTAVKRRTRRDDYEEEDDDGGEDDDDGDDYEQASRVSSSASSKSASKSSSSSSSPYMARPSAKKGAKAKAAPAPARPTRQVAKSVYREAGSDDEFDFAPLMTKVARVAKAPKKRASSPDLFSASEMAEYKREKRELDMFHGWRYKPTDEEQMPSPIRLDKRLLYLRSQSREKEFFVSWKGMCHLRGEWVSESKAKFLNKVKLSNFKTRNPEPVSSENDPPVPSDWLVCTRVIDEDGDGNAQCLWGGLEYERATWEPIDSLADDVNFNEQLLHFHQRQARVDGTIKMPKGKPRPDPATAKNFAALTAEEIGLAVPPFPHQVEGISWLMYKWVQGENVILGDEMGLGKTCQTIGVLNVLQRLFLRRRFLVVAPLTTLSNWVREVNRFLPGCDVFVVSGSEESRNLCYEKDMEHGAFDVVVTSYEVAMNNIQLFDFAWDAMILDEGHRIKNVNSLATQKLRQLKADWIVILTGTPVQNNPEELTNMLYFLKMKGLDTPARLAEKFSMENLKKPEVVNELHSLVRPRLLRRVKEDIDLGIPDKVEIVVPVGLGELQKEQYKIILSANFNYLARLGQDAKRNKPLCSIFAQLRKCVQHPYLFPEAEKRDPNMSKEVEYARLIDASGKLKLLNKMLTKLQEKGHRVLIFSQYVIMLDVLDDFLTYRQHKFERIDGSTPYALRQQAIDRFNAPNSDRFCFLLSTRATRLGINLATADTVIIYDADFNPQNDLQALSRAHRMGQTKFVAVYTLVARHTVEERLLEIARSKRFLEHIVVESIEEELEASTLNQMLAESSQKLFSEEEKPIVYDDAAVEALLDRQAHIAASMERAKEEKKAKLARAQKGDKQEVSSFKFARVWEATDGEAAPEAAVSAAPAPALDVSSFWSELLAEERLRIKEAEAAKATMYGKGKRNRSQIIVQQLQFSDDSVSDESSFEEDSKPFWAFAKWLRKEHPAELADRSSKIWKNLSDANKRATSWWKPVEPKTLIEIANVASPEEFALLPEEEKRRCIDVLRVDRERFERETAARMPDDMAEAVAGLGLHKKSRTDSGGQGIVAASAAGSSSAETKTPRAKRKPSVVEDATPETVTQLHAMLQEGQKLNVKQKRVLRMDSMVSWVRENHPSLLEAASANELLQALKEAGEATRSFKGCSFSWKPLRGKDAWSIYRIKVQGRMTHELKGKGEPFSLRSEVDRAWLNLPPEEQLKYHAEAAECLKKYHRERDANLPDCWAVLKRNKRSAARASPRRPAPPPSAVVVDVDEEQREGDEELDLAMAQRVSKMSHVEKRALRYFKERETPLLQEQRPDMRGIERDQFVLNLFEVMSAEQKKELLDKSEQHYAKKHYKSASSVVPPVSGAVAKASPARPPAPAVVTPSSVVKKPPPAWTTPRVATTAAPAPTPAPAPQSVSPQQVVVIKPKKAVKREW